MSVFPGWRRDLGARASIGFHPKDRRGYAPRGAQTALLFRPLRRRQKDER